ncbi:MAG: hypothetical protein ACREUE_02145, partial [Panacagrimonas sp.]
MLSGFESSDPAPPADEATTTPEPTPPPAAPAADEQVAPYEVIALPPKPPDVTSEPVPAPPTAIEEVVVTARRTAENLQDVPVAISALSAEDLIREQINSPQDLQGRVPSLLI